MPMIKSKLCFFDVQEEILVRQAIKFCEPSFRKGPERFDAIGVIFAARKFVFGVENSVIIAI